MKLPEITHDPLPDVRTDRVDALPDTTRILQRAFVHVHAAGPVEREPLRAFAQIFTGRRVHAGALTARRPFRAKLDFYN